MCVKSNGFSKIRKIRLFRQGISENLNCLQTRIEKFPLSILGDCMRLFSKVLTAQNIFNLLIYKDIIGGNIA